MKNRQHWTDLEAFLEIARDLTASLATSDRYERLLDIVRRIIPCDAACLLRLEGTALIPVAGYGLRPEALARRYPLEAHPRLDIILKSSPHVVRFSPESPMADPFDGLLSGEPSEHIHACLGCSLTQGERIVGALTADALDPEAFEQLNPQVLETLAALAGAAMHTTWLIESLEAVAERRGSVARELQRRTNSLHGEGLLGESPAMQRLLRDIDVVAPSDLPVLITGETGTGKELVARRLHACSLRQTEPLIQVNCAALAENLVESELFGHVTGSFTGATANRVGKFELADRGTLFLDEVGELPLSIQPKLLRALQEGELQRVGSDRLHKVDVRVVAATNRKLEKEVEAGRFRADLYHRLAVYPLRVPALRERVEDISLLASHFLEGWRRRLGLGAVQFTREALNSLMAHAWQGNVRELENTLGRALLRASRARPVQVPLWLQPSDFALEPFPSEETQEFSSSSEARNAGSSLREQVDKFQRQLIQDAVAKNEGNWAAAARELGMHRSNLHHLARRLELR